MRTGIFHLTHKPDVEGCGVLFYSPWEREEGGLERIPRRKVTPRLGAQVSFSQTGFILAGAASTLLGLCPCSTCLGCIFLLGKLPSFLPFRYPAFRRTMCQAITFLCFSFSCVVSHKPAVCAAHVAWFSGPEWLGGGGGSFGRRI